MKSEEFATAVRRRLRKDASKRIIISIVLLFCAAANCSLFTFPFSLLHAQGVQKGKASFYAKKFSGRRTASGERLHHDSMTCAHRTYPFGTVLRVTNLSNGKDVVVRVTDRGPYRKGRIIDLSWGAAKAIGMISQGVTQVIVERLPQATIPYKLVEQPDSLPIFEFDIAEISSGTTPVWQLDKSATKIDERKVQREMKRTAEKMKAQATPTTNPLGRRTQATNGTQEHPTTNTKHQTPTTQHPEKDELDEINNSPNRSRAYQKRNQGNLK